jgi:hypothetical protein
VRAAASLPPGFQPFDLGGHDSQHHFGRREILARRGDVRPEVEQVVLDAQKRFGRVFVSRQYGKTDGAVGLVHRTDRLEARRMLGLA